MALTLKDHDRHSYADYLGWPEDVRYELIDGIAYLMAPAPTVRHQDIAGEMFRQIANGKPDVQELAGETPVGVLPGVTILRAALAARLPQPEC